MSRSTWWVILIAVWAVIGVGAWYWWQQQEAEPQPPQPPRAEAPAPPAPAPVPAEPEVRHPIEEAQPEAPPEPTKAPPLPALGGSDKTVLDALAGLIGRAALAFVEDTDIVRHVVATVDNLPRKQAPPRVWPVKPTAGRLVTAGKGEDVYLSPENDRRYQPFLRVMEAADTGKLVALYVRLYPLFQQAYVELGYPKRHFNDRVIEVIDHLLATPEASGPIKVLPPDVKGPLKLERPWLMYKFADPELEARSAGQKILIRMGTANAARVKAKLREIRRQLTRRGTTP
jgi:hypothetical protein